MQFQIEELSPIQKRVQVSVPASRVDSGFSTAYNKISQRARMPGFRKGKVPPGYLEKRFGAEATAQVAEDLMQEGWNLAIREYNLRPVGRPQVDSDRPRRGHAFDFKITVETLPEVELLPAGDFTGTKTVWNASADVVEHELTHLQEQFARFEPVTDRDDARKGDQVVIDFVGRVDDDEFDGGKAEDVDLTLGTGQFIPGFEEGIIGHKRDESFEIEITFPGDYRATQLAGKTATFAITLKDIKVQVLPEIGDELAAEAGEKDLAALKEVVKARIEQVYNRRSINELKADLKNQIAEKYTFTLPDALVADVLKDQLEERKQALQRQGKSAAEIPALLAAEATEQQGRVERDLRVELVLGALGEAEAITVSEHEVNSVAEQTARQMIQQMGPEFAAQIRQMYRDPNQRESLRRRIRQDKALDVLLDKANLTVVEQDVPPHVHDDAPAEGAEASPADAAE